MAKYVFQINHAMAYQYEYQDKIQSALSSRSTVNLFTFVLTNDGKTATIVTCTYYKGKDKSATGMFSELSYKKYIPSNIVIQKEIIWSDRLTPEF